LLGDGFRDSVTHAAVKGGLIIRFFVLTGENDIYHLLATRQASYMGCQDFAHFGVLSLSVWMKRKTCAIG
jgi:hypothetical protein